MNEVIRWLRSPAGEAWSARYHLGTEGEGGNPARFSHGMFATIKYDHECHWNGREYEDCKPYQGYVWADNLIRDEMERFGMNGLPEAA